MKLLWALLCTASLYATPTSVFWTNCTTAVQPYGTCHLGIDTLSKSFPLDFGLTGGVLSYKGIRSEVGIDYITKVSRPFYGNGKIAVDEGFLFAHFPSVSVGVFSLGTSSKSNLRVLDLVFGTTLPFELGSFYAGLYKGRKRALGKHNAGWMVAYQIGFDEQKELSGITYYKWQLSADFASNKNVLGGGGVGVAYFFSRTVNLLMGPVWFADRKVNGNWNWSIQLDIDF